MSISPGIFKAYDVRGEYPGTLNEDVARRVGSAFARYIAGHPDSKGRPLAVGHDMRLSSPALAKAAIDGITAQGHDVLDLGRIGTDMSYFAVGHYGLDGGLMITASHNPKQWNGMKMVRAGAFPISGDQGLPEIRQMALGDHLAPASHAGSVQTRNIYEPYATHVLSFVDTARLKRFRIVGDPGNGMGGQIANHLFTHIPADLVKMNWEPDGSFPHHEPNPMLPENQAAVIARVTAEKADLGLMWDGDADRCFLIDAKGQFVEGYFITALLARAMLRKYPGCTIICDPRNIWAVVDTVQKNGGRLVINKAGHSFFKAAMKREDAVFAGEMSGHYYFRDNFNADSGMIPMALMLELMSDHAQSLHEMLAPFRAVYHISGELNFKAPSDKKDAAAEAMADVRAHFATGEFRSDDVDEDPEGRAGYSVSFGREWRFNVRPSNTEPLVRLNVESASASLTAAKTKEIEALLEKHGLKPAE